MSKMTREKRFHESQWTESMDHYHSAKRMDELEDSLERVVMAWGLKGLRYHQMAQRLEGLGQWGLAAYWRRTRTA